MKKINKISASILTLSLITMPLVQPVHTFAASLKLEQTENGNQQKGQNRSTWDRSSLSFISENVQADSVSATIQNGQDSEAMQGEVIYEVFWSKSGNPKAGEVVATGVIKALDSGELQQLTYTAAKGGQYKFKAYQRQGHPGKGELWSESVTVDEESISKESVDLERPFDQFFQSDVTKGTATFTVPEGMNPVEISFSSYAYPDGIIPQEDGKPYDGQTIYNNITNVYAPGTYTVDIDLPDTGYWQTDLYLGTAIETLAEEGHPMDKVIDADYGSQISN